MNLEADLFKKQKLEPNSLSFWLGSLRGRLENSKTLWVKLPVVLHNSRYGTKILAVAPAKISKYLDMPPEAVKKVTESFIYFKAKNSAIKSRKSSREERATLYREMLESGEFKNRAALAQHLGVSRAWVTKMMNTRYLPHK